MHQAAYGIIGIAAGGGDRFAAGHSSGVATAIDVLGPAFEQDDVGHDGQVTHIVAAVDGVDVVVRLRSSAATAFNVHQHGDAASDGDTVTAAIDVFDMAAVFRTGGV